MKRIASVSPITLIASLALSTRHSAVLARSIPCFHSGAKHHRPAFTSSLHRLHHRQSNALQPHVFRSSISALQSASSDGENDSNDFFGDGGDRGGNFFEDVQKSPPQKTATSDGENGSNSFKDLGVGEDGAGAFFEDVQKPPSQKNEEEQPATLEELEMLAGPFDEHLPKLNTVTLVGRVGNDPEPRYFDDGKVVLNLSLAVKRKYHPLERKVRNIRSGDEETDWFALEFWGRDAEYVTNYVEKGARLGVTGSLAVDGWVDKMTGEQRRKPKIIVRHTDILESRAEAELRKGNRGSYDGNSGGKKYDDDDEEGGPSPAGTGGFFS